MCVSSSLVSLTCPYTFLSLFACSCGGGGCCVSRPAIGAENELVLVPGAQLHVTGIARVAHDGGLTMVTVREIDEPLTLADV